MEDEVLFRVAVPAGLLIAFCIWWWLSEKDHKVPYGRHHATAAAQLCLPWTHFMLPTRLGWGLMESPPLLLTPPLYAIGKYSSLPAPRALIALFLAHYAHRCFLYPVRMRPSQNRNLPFIVFLSAVLFNIYNTYIQVRSISQYTQYPLDWLSSPQFTVGVILFVSGMGINISADATLISLRKSAPFSPNAEPPKAYKIPRGGLFELVSCPNFFGELVEWLGWAMATSSFAGLVFFLLCVANLVPRAVAHHQWYIEQFPEYPRSRKALVPFLF